MPKGNWKKVMVIGSGPIVIGQAAEFDYAGTQACRALREEGIETVLVNSNPATIMTDKEVADKVYIEPLTLEFLERIIEKERPDGLLPTMGGQTGLNLAFQLSKAGVLKRCGVTLLGTPLDSISKAEDREHFRNLMQQINQPIPQSTIVSDVEEALRFAEEIGYPKASNVAILGALGRLLRIEKDQFMRVIAGKIAPRYLPANEKSFDGGWASIQFT